MIYAGDEIGLETKGPEYARIPIPWAHKDRWDQTRLSYTQALFTTRAGSTALRRGGLRWLYIGEDALVFLREAPTETVLVHAARADHTPVLLPAVVVGRELVGLAGTPDLRVVDDGMISLPSSGQSFGMWRLQDI
jgi:alpha-glucosidase